MSGGDQPTVERQRNAKRHVMDSDTATERLECFEPKIEDWHALQIFLMVSTCMVLGQLIPIKVGVVIKLMAIINKA